MFRPCARSSCLQEALHQVSQEGFYNLLRRSTVQDCLLSLCVICANSEMPPLVYPERGSYLEDALQNGTCTEFLNFCLAVGEPK